MESSITMPGHSSETKILTDLKIRLKNPDKLALGSSIYLKKQECTKAKTELSEHSKKVKSIIAKKEAQIDADIEALKTGVRVIKDAECILKWVPSEGKVEMTHEGRLIDKRDPTKYDSDIFNRTLFPEEETTPMQTEEVYSENEASDTTGS